MRRLLLLPLVLLGGCRYRFESLEADGGTDTPPLAATCGDTALFEESYTCTPTAPGPAAHLMFSLGAATTCSWLTVTSDTGVVTGLPSQLGTCTAELMVESTSGEMQVVQWAIKVITVVKQIDIGARHACALSTAGTVRCWGQNVDGQLGYNDRIDVGDGAPGRSIRDMGDVPVGGRVTQISLGYLTTCALLDTGGVRCWGPGDNSRLGYEHLNDVGAGDVGGSIIDNGDLPLGGKAIKIATLGGTGGCALLETGAVRCWGLWHGHGNTTQLRGAAIVAAGDVPIGTGPIVAIAGGYSHACALTQQGTVRCWGIGGDGELGYGDGLDVGTSGTDPTIAAAGDVPIGGTAVQISTGDMTTCAVLQGGTLRCWGANNGGQLGYNDTLSVADGTANRNIVDLGDVPVGKQVRSAWAGEQHTCAALVDDSVRCWGFNFVGQLGYDDTLNVGDGSRSIIAVGDVPVGGPVLDVVTTDWDTGFTCARMVNRSLRCWGENSFGQLGRDHTLIIGDGGAGGTIAASGDLHPFAD